MGFIIRIKIHSFPLESNQFSTFSVKLIKNKQRVSSIHYQDHKISNSQPALRIPITVHTKQPHTFGGSTNHDHSNNSLLWASHRLTTQTQIPKDRKLVYKTPIYFTKFKVLWSKNGFTLSPTQSPPNVRTYVTCDLSSPKGTIYISISKTLKTKQTQQYWLPQKIKTL